MLVPFPVLWTFPVRTYLHNLLGSISPSHIPCTQPIPFPVMCEWAIIFVIGISFKFCGWQWVWTSRRYWFSKGFQACLRSTLYRSLPLGCYHCSCIGRRYVGTAGSGLFPCRTRTVSKCLSCKPIKGERYRLCAYTLEQDSLLIPAIGPKSFFNPMTEILRYFSSLAWWHFCPMWF